MYLNTVFKYNVFKYCPALIILDVQWIYEKTAHAVKKRVCISKKKKNVPTYTFDEDFWTNGSLNLKRSENGVGGGGWIMSGLSWGVWWVVPGSDLTCDYF